MTSSDDLAAIVARIAESNRAARDQADGWTNRIVRAIGTGDQDALSDVIKEATELEGATPEDRPQAGDDGVVDGGDRSSVAAEPAGNESQESGSGE